MALSEAFDPTRVDPRNERRSHQETIVLPFGGNVVVIDNKFMLWAYALKKPERPVRSMLLYITAPLNMTLYTPHRLEEGFQRTEDVNPDAIATVPCRISDNPKRSAFILGLDYEITFVQGTGNVTSPEGSLVIRLNSKKPVVKESIPRPADFVTELKARMGQTVPSASKPEVPTEFSQDFFLGEDPNRRIMIDRKFIVGVARAGIESNRHGGVKAFVTADTGIPVLSQDRLEKRGWKSRASQASGRICTVPVRLNKTHPFLWLGEIGQDHLAIEFKVKSSGISVFTVSSKNPITLERVECNGDFNAFLQNKQVKLY